MEAAIHSDLVRGVRGEFRKMTRRQRQVSRLRIFCGLNSAEIAETAGISPTNASHTYCLAKRELMNGLRWSWAGVEGIADAAERRRGAA